MKLIPEYRYHKIDVKELEGDTERAWDRAHQFRTAIAGKPLLNTADLTSEEKKEKSRSIYEVVAAASSHNSTEGQYAEPRVRLAELKFCLKNNEDNPFVTGDMILEAKRQQDKYEREMRKLNEALVETNEKLFGKYKGDHKV